jgi:glycosyltransferase involved in cell wall biosynthesis
VVYGNTFSGTFFCALGKLGSRVPLVFDRHGVPEEILLWREKNHTAYITSRIMDRISLRVSDRILCVSRAMMRYLQHGGVPSERLIYLTNGVDLDYFKPARSERGDDLRAELGIGDERVFGYIGYFQKYQGVESVVAAAETYQDKNALFLFIGGDVQERRGNAIFIPRVNRAEIARYYGICDILILPRPAGIATEVAAPTKFAEYVAMGKPVLTTRVGDAATLVEQYGNGIVIDNNSTAHLVEAIQKCMALDQSELVRMGRNSRVMAEKEFDWVKCSQDFVRYLKGLETHASNPLE